MILCANSMYTATDDDASSPLETSLYNQHEHEHEHEHEYAVSTAATLAAIAVVSEQGSTGTGTAPAGQPATMKEPSGVAQYDPHELSDPQPTVDEDQKFVIEDSQPPPIITTSNEHQQAIAVESADGPVPSLHNSMASPPPAVTSENYTSTVPASGQYQQQQQAAVPSLPYSYPQIPSSAPTNNDPVTTSTIATINNNNNNNPQIQMTSNTMHNFVPIFHPTMAMPTMIPMYYPPPPPPQQQQVYSYGVPQIFLNRTLRSGKWTHEEEVYANLLVDHFEYGLVNEKNGSTLRSYLSRKLHCAPMRISKKFAGKGIGKMVYISKQTSSKTLSSTEVASRTAKVQQAEHSFYQIAFPELTYVPGFGQSTAAPHHFNNSNNYGAHTTVGYSPIVPIIAQPNQQLLFAQSNDMLPPTITQLTSQTAEMPAPVHVLQHSWTQQGSQQLACTPPLSTNNSPPIIIDLSQSPDGDHTEQAVDNSADIDAEQLQKTFINALASTDTHTADAIQGIHHTTDEEEDESTHSGNDEDDDDDDDDDWDFDDTEEHPSIGSILQVFSPMMTSRSFDIMHRFWRNEPIPATMAYPVSVNPKQTDSTSTAPNDKAEDAEATFLSRKRQNADAYVLAAQQSARQVSLHSAYTSSVEGNIGTWQSMSVFPKTATLASAPSNTSSYGSGNEGSTSNTISDLASNDSDGTLSECSSRKKMRRRYHCNATGKVS